MKSIVACYLRVSTIGQNEAGQRLEIQRWLDGNNIKPCRIRRYLDKESGDNLDRPDFERLQRDIFSGDVGTVVVFKLDRLSRTIHDGLAVLCGWCDQEVRVVSVTQAIDFNGTIGKMIAAVLFGVAEMEQQTRRERQAAGIAAARESGKKWGGSKSGRRTKATPEKIAVIRRLKSEGKPVASIARTVDLHRSTIYSVLNGNH